VIQKKWLIGLCTAALLLLNMVFVVAAQDDARDGSIRGTVYLDLNGNGQCVNEGEPIHVGVPIEFVSNDGQWSHYLATGEDGTYGLVGAGYGTWQVSARPNANDFVVTSEPTLSVFIGSDQKLALNIDFCIQAIDGTSGNVVASSATANAILPQAGGSFTGGVLYIVATLVGLLFIGGGAWISLRRA